MITIQRHIKNLLLLFVVFTMASCRKPHTDVWPAMYMVFVNNSSHNLEIIREDFNSYLDNVLPKNIILAPNEDIELDTRTAYVYNHFSTIIFDGYIRIKLSKELSSPHNIMFRENYTEEHLLKTHTWYYTYTFTDADYQFALENGTKLEW